ncbi:16S rRNA (cytosine(967)-C(5))-methyltransferase RsmB [Spiroplasma tabanidicola]|nr:16S rRNA (cytosine(967)-C(5))-methyltransferase RsmB [Spiroplasma tabanidicola]
MHSNNARLISLNILYGVFKEDKQPNKLLNELSNTKAMSKSDIAFVFKMVYGTIQYKIYLEYVVNKIIKPNKTNYKIQLLLWLNLYQIKFLNTPQYSVNNEAVEVAKIIDNNLAGFVNATTKKLANLDLWKVDIKNNQNKIPLEYGFPFWLYKSLEQDYSKEIALQIVQSSNNQTMFSFRVNENKISQIEFEKLYKHKFNLKKSKIAKNCYLTDFNIINTQVFDQGLVFIQDETSILAVELLDLEKQSKVIDMCCAPGGKLSYIASLVDKKNLVDAFEINENKKNIIYSNLNRLGINNVNIEFKSALNINKKYERILLDAPCSGFGVLKRKPDIKLKKFSKKDMDALYQLQFDLLQKGFEHLLDEGILVYSTCTINKKENQNQIKVFLDNNKNAKLIFEKQFFGFEGNNNGFYIAKIKKLKK